MKKQEIYYVTGNPGKFDEVKRYIESNEPTIELKQLNLDTPEPQTLDQHYIAKVKARAAWDVLQKPLIVDDSGIFFDAYNNFPGTLTKFVHAGIGLDGAFKLLEENNKATFRLTLVYIDGPESLELFEGICPGQLVPARAEAPPTLPWDAIFLPDGSDKTYAELRGTPGEDEYFYRIRALKAFLNWFKAKPNTTSKPLASHPN